MKIEFVTIRRLAWIACLMLFAVIPELRAAERELHWDALDVDAQLDGDGVLNVVERHTMVFTGDWNGGERIFNIRPRQKLDFIGIARLDPKTGERHPLRQVSTPDEIDEYVISDSRTVRWRSRLPSDPSFAATTLIYELHYKLSPILLKDGDHYRLDHDFAFPNRAGSIFHFTLTLFLDSAWHPLSEVQEHYSAGPLTPGQNFVLTVPLRYSGTGAPSVMNVRLPKEIVGAIAAILLGFILIVFGFFAHEQALGRFASFNIDAIDQAWLKQHVLAYPAEVVGAVWDGRVGTSEVVSLIARMTAEGKLATDIVGREMTLRLKVKRETLNGHERALVDGLFFGDRKETSTKAVQQHYKSRGFNPAGVIKPQLTLRMKEVTPAGTVRVNHAAGIVLFLAGAVMMGWTIVSDPQMTGPVVMAFIVLVVLSLLMQIPGWLFRSRMDWEIRGAAALTIPAFLFCVVVMAFLLFVAGTAEIEPPPMMIGGIAAWTLFIANASITGMKSRQSAAAIAFRKRLAAGRTYFLRELQRPKPSLRDEWYPWLLAFGLGDQMDVWSTSHGAAETTSYTSSDWHGHSSSTSSSGSSTSSTRSTWTGGGGLSGGAGATGAWAAAATGMAVGVAAPSSSSSSSGGGSSSSSSGGSSGGGGGGGW